MKKTKLDFFKRSLNAHSWMGLMIGALMYLICLSGTIAVFFEELEYWEQPNIEQYSNYDPVALDRTFNEFLNNNADQVTSHMYLVLPRKQAPSAAIATETQGWYLNQDGSLGAKIDHRFTDIITDLHLYLHLPKTWGMIIVSMSGVLLLSLIISGLLSHRTIIKDAFKLRLFGGKQLEQTDIHNRLSVWGAPFHIMISVTGAYFGLLALIVFVYSGVINEKDPYSLSPKIFGEEPQLNQVKTDIEIASILEQMQTLAPDTEIQFLIVHEANTPQQFVEVFTKLNDRLIFTENYAFDQSGKLLDRRGFSDGVLGKQVVYSMYRLHFGFYGGEWVKVLYFILGLAITVISASGINIWLAKRKYKDVINHVWSGFVWGAPLALIVPAITKFMLAWTSSGLFWVVLVACCCYGAIVRNEQIVKRNLLWSILITGIFLISVYCFQYGSFAFIGVPLMINIGILLGLIVLAAYLILTNKWVLKERLSN